MSTSRDVVQLLTVAGVGGVAVEVVRSVLQRRKMGADYADVIARSATSLLEPLAKRVAELEISLASERQESQKARDEAHGAHQEAEKAHAQVTLLTTDLQAARGEVRALRREVKALRADNAAASHPEGL